MGHIFFLMGKSSSGKDTIYNTLTGIKGFPLKKVVGYTTRPVRSGETNGKEYYFVDNDRFEEMKSAGIVIESRSYNTVHGIWTYFTADDGQINLEKSDYILIGTLESYEKLKDYFGKDNIIPIYIQVENGERLFRALSRERGQKNPKYAEMCRRFLADEDDFSEDKLEKSHIEKRYNNICLNDCIDEICDTIRNVTGTDF